MFREAHADILIVAVEQWSRHHSDSETEKAPTPSSIKH